MLFRKQWPNKLDVVEGKAASVISTAFVVGKIVMAVTVAIVNAPASNDTRVLMLVPCGFSALAFFLIVCTDMPPLIE